MPVVLDEADGGGANLNALSPEAALGGACIRVCPNNIVGCEPLRFWLDGGGLKDENTLFCVPAELGRCCVATGPHAEELDVVEFDGKLVFLASLDQSIPDEL